MIRMTNITKLVLLLLLVTPGLMMSERGMSTTSISSISVETKSLPSANRGLLVKNGRLLFPIGFYELPKDDAELEKMAQSGINLVRCHNKTDLDRANSVGMLGWISLPLQSGNSDSLRKRIESLVTHPALAIWEGPDEIVHNFTAWSGLYRTKGIYKSPDEWRKQTPRAIKYSEEQARQIIPNIRDSIQLIRTLDHEKRQIWINEAAQSDLKFVRQYMNHIDITGCDIYPVREGKRDVAIVGDATQRWKQVGRNQKPVWMVLQAFSWSELGDYYGHKTVVYPSFAESRFMAYDVIVHGAKGILYWGSHYIQSSEFRRSLYALTSELEALQPFLVAPEHQNTRISLIELSRDASERGVKISVRKVEGEWIIILVNEDDRTYMGVEVTGLGALNGRDLELLYGQEKITVQQGELITRIKPLEVKVYSTSRKYETDLHKGRDFQK